MAAGGLPEDAVDFHINPLKARHMSFDCRSLALTDFCKNRPYCRAGTMLQNLPEYVVIHHEAISDIDHLRFPSAETCFFVKTDGGVVFIDIEDQSLLSG